MKRYSLLFIIPVITFFLSIAHAPLLFSNDKDKSQQSSPVKKTTQSGADKQSKKQDSQSSKKNENNNKAIKYEKKIYGYCCNNETVVRKKMTSSAIGEDEQCTTAFSKTQSFCGACCRSGRASSVSNWTEKKNCRKEGGTFIGKASDCKPKKVFCCIGGSVKHRTIEECKKNNVPFYKSEKQANKNCGWLCENSKIFSSDKLKTSLKRRKLYPSRKDAEKACRDESSKGYCCTTKGVASSNRAQCKNPDRFFTNEIRAQKWCSSRKMKLKKTAKIGGRNSITKLSHQKKLRQPFKPAQRQHNIIPRFPSKGVEDGIRVIQPEGGESIRAGDDVIVRYDILESGRPLPHTVVISIRDSSLSLRWELYRGGPQENVDITLPVPLEVSPGEGYTITVASINEADRGPGRYGMSDPFRVTVLTSSGGEICEGCVFFVTPEGGEYWSFGLQTIEWLFTGSTDVPDDWQITLLRGRDDSTGIVEEIPLSRYATEVDTINPADDSPTAWRCRIAWDIPDHIPQNSQYRIRVQSASDESIRAISRPFTIGVLLFIRPAGGETWYIGNEERIEWTDALDSRGYELEVIGLDGGVVQSWTGDIPHPNRASYLWHIGRSHSLGREQPLEEGSYRLRLTHVESSIRVDSPVFSILRPTLSIARVSHIRWDGESEFRTDNFELGDRVDIRWTAENFPDETLVTIRAYCTTESPHYEEHFDYIENALINRGSASWTIPDGMLQRGADYGECYIYFNINYANWLEEGEPGRTSGRHDLPRTNTFYIGRDFNYTHYSNPNQDDCEEYCYEHRPECVECSRNPGCGMGYDRMHSFTSAGHRNWYACEARSVIE